MTTDQHFYIGIDLGTTNSSMHWGALNPGTNRVEPRPLSFDQVSDDGSIRRHVLVPSYIWYRQGDEMPTVGEFARTKGLEAQPSRVARGIKNFMGNANWTFDVDGRSYTAAQLSAVILQTMFAGIKKTWGNPVNDVVITVPASFDSDMRADTLEAAELAGFKVLENDRSVRNLLLDEPRAALYDFLNQQLSGHLPPGIQLDLSTPKFVLVFDLGGGTLDVSLHKVRQSSEVDEIGVDDLAISRYTQLGGGVFDNLVADELQRQFEAKARIKLDDLPASDRHQIRIKLEVQAEQVKQRLTNDIEQRISQGMIEVPGDFSVDIQMPFLFDTRGLFTRLTKDEFEAIISPLLAPGLTIEAVENFDQLTYAGNNIIFPILDVLHKAKNKLGDKIPRVDAVVLNGGMTRVHAIRQRLEHFFGLRPITVLDPEHAVSRGAAVYHYLLHRGWRPRQILAESIGVEIEGSRIFNLAPAGTVLPYQQKFPGRFSIPYENTNRVTIPLYRGEKTTPEPPNKKILERQFIFSSPQVQGTPIDVELTIDDNKLVHFTAALPNGEKAEVRVGAEQTIEEPKPSAPVKKASSGVAFRPSGPPLNPAEFRQNYKLLANQWDEPGLKQLGNKAMIASNAPELMQLLIQDFSFFSRPGKQRAAWLMGEFAEHYPQDSLVPAIVDTCLESIRSSMDNEKALATVGRNAVVALGKIGSGVAESHLINILKDDRVQPIRSDILFALGKCGSSVNVLRHAVEYIDSDRDGERIAALWALGRLGSREHEPLMPISKVTELITFIGRHAVIKIEPHIIARKYAVYALGEIGDRRPTLGHQDVVDKEHAEYILMVLSQVIDSLKKILKGAPGNGELRQTENLAKIAYKQVMGEKLTEDESRVLMSLRTLLSVVE